MRYDLHTRLNAYTRVSEGNLNDFVREAPNDGNVYGRQNEEWVKLDKSVLNETFMAGPINKEVLTASDINDLEQSHNPTSSKFDLSFNLIEDSYIWFCSKNEIDYVAQVGGVEIDLIEQEQDVGVIYADGSQDIWHCYRTTYPLLSGKWNFIVKLKEISN